MRQAEEAVKRADTRLIWTLGHVDSYLRELNESKTGIGHFLQSWALAEKLKKAIRPILVKELVQKPDLTDQEIRRRIESLVEEAV